MPRNSAVGGEEEAEGEDYEESGSEDDSEGDEEGGDDGDDEGEREGSPDIDHVKAAEPSDMEATLGVGDNSDKEAGGYLARGEVGESDDTGPRVTDAARGDEDSVGRTAATVGGDIQGDQGERVEETVGDRGHSVTGKRKISEVEAGDVGVDKVERLPDDSEVSLNMDSMVGVHVTEEGEGQAAPGAGAVDGVSSGENGEESGADEVVQKQIKPRKDKNESYRKLLLEDLKRAKRSKVRCAVGRSELCMMADN